MSSIQADASGPNNAAVTAQGQGGAQGVYAQSDSAAGIVALSHSGPGASISSLRGTGIFVAAGEVGNDAQAAFARTNNAIVAMTNEVGGGALYAVSSQGTAVYAQSASAPSVLGENLGSAEGVWAASESGPGVTAKSRSGVGLAAESVSGLGARISSLNATGIIVTVGSALSPSTGPSVFGGSAAALEELGLEHAGYAVAALTDVQDKAGLYAQSSKGPGVQASGSSIGLDASSSHGIAVRAHSDTGVGLRVEGSLQVQGPAVGKVMTQAGQTSLQVQSSAVTTQSLVLLTPLGNPGAMLWVDPPAAGQFTIHASQALPGGLTIQYLVIN
jgi:hypothetical protein